MALTHLVLRPSSLSNETPYYLGTRDRETWENITYCMQTESCTALLPSYSKIPLLCICTPPWRPQGSYLRLSRACLDATN